MKIVTDSISLSTKGNNDVVDITYQVEEKLRQTQLEEGMVLLFVQGSTAALTTMEYEPGQIQDLQEVMETLVPRNKDYAHNHSASGSDANAHSHLRASLLGPSLTVPFLNSKMTLGIWQQIIFVDFDNRCREREIMVQAVGE